ncbi:hypothetical protein BASA50_004886 [Batrachochytrium salamandrivorans]|uniref:Thiamine diphosphokinase n=1 Tax=Batrachochytrium salamandrivorans TaxID=1357716 RepID=A0ABQ8FFK2_9FUNG|nr:hypothetical protein BASA62_002713 [Batrachochytrium salamandrivorans]KAH6582965.1 hypothetical protein BASA60_001671 [Batrachochytrium salamandrivorans]KAH6596818.1 hypothetical protein BASA50_004886 [Batrachochytrium salamandrivorans]KAJ1330087.1 thiamine pyrophosphokinase [Batrachochytrium salamandrivorans]
MNEWRVYDFFSTDKVLADTSHRRALLILNQPLCRLSCFETLWQNVSVRMCADGGANRLYDTLATDELRTRFIPNFICGDLDSLRPDVREFYRSAGVEIIWDPSQDSTDFQKCLRHFEKVYETPGGEMMHVLAFGALSGRLDQTIGSLSTLFRQPLQRKLYLASNDSIATLIRPVPASLETPPSEDLSTDVNARLCHIWSAKGFEGPCCGIGSLGCDARVISTGLKWNLDKTMVLNFDKLWSSSNAFENDDTPHRHGWSAESELDDHGIPSVVNTGHIEYMHVTIDTDKPVLWTVEVDLG